MYTELLYHLDISLYNLLGVQRTATLSELEENFNKLHLKYTKEKLDESIGEIEIAYNVLTDEDKRKEYDDYL